jgi:hypothetical protein
MLPHNDVFLLVTAAFIQFIRPRLTWDTRTKDWHGGLAYEHNYHP